MKSLNRAELIGRVTANPEVKTTSNGKKVVNFSIATNYDYKDATWVKKDGVDYHNITLFDKAAELAEQMLTQWKMVYIEWKLTTSSWEWEDGVKRSKTSIIWHNFLLMNSRNESKWVENNNVEVKENKKVETKTNTPQTMESEIEDIPF